MLMYQDTQVPYSFNPNFNAIFKEWPDSMGGSGTGWFFWFNVSILVITLMNFLANLCTMVVKLCTSMCTNSQQEQRMKNTRAIRDVASRLLRAEDALAICREQEELNNTLDDFTDKVFKKVKLESVYPDFFALRPGLVVEISLALVDILSDIYSIGNMLLTDNWIFATLMIAILVNSILTDQKEGLVHTLHGESEKSLARGLRSKRFLDFFSKEGSVEAFFSFAVTAYAFPYCTTERTSFILSTVSLLTATWSMAACIDGLMMDFEFTEVHAESGMGTSDAASAPSDSVGPLLDVGKE